jgi:hypothetical protein
VTAKTTKYLEAIHQHSSSALEGVDFPTNEEKILQTVLVCSVNEGWKLKVLQANWPTWMPLFYRKVCS